MLEIIAFDIESCTTIEKAGAHRIELCANPAEGGTTPSHGMIKTARKITQIDLFPIIRPRGGDFLYSNDEFEVMKQDIMFCKKTGCDGVVSGLLKADGTIDKERTSLLVSLAYPMEFTFHRAFDRVVNMEQALTDVIHCGCTRILTSGLYSTAIEGMHNIKTLVSLADHRIRIMPGSGIRANNITTLLQQTGATEIHSSARILKPSAMEKHNPCLPEKPESVSADPEEIKELLQAMQYLTHL
ncbi:MAG: copper homeostasis protein CutC [Sphingobacteriales bacterium]|nr:copper homeostasis protein CutC [Sphingobacteriales bacterium]